MSQKPRSDIGLLVIVWVGLVSISATIIYVGHDGFTTFDSFVYLHNAENLVSLTGRFYTHPFKGNAQFNTVWPLGYPLVIGFISKITTISFFWSSKIANWLAWVACLVLMYSINPKKSWFLSLFLLNGTYIKLFSYTWSEALFVTTELYFLHILNLSHVRTFNWRYFATLTVVMIILFLFRYIGIFSILVCAIVGVWCFYRGSYTKMKAYLVVSIVTSVFVVCYFMWNYSVSGFFTGHGGRLTELPTAAKFVNIAEALFNELLIIKDLDRETYSLDVLFVAGLVFQIAVLSYCIYQWRKSFVKAVENTFLKIGVLSSACYLFTMLAIWLFSDLESLYFRYMAPFSFPLFLAILNWVAQPQNHLFFKKVKYALTVLFLLGLLNVLPGKNWIERTPKMVEKASSIFR